MRGFERRSYGSPGQLWRDLAFLIERRRTLPSVLGGQAISAAFRERLMLVVTAVNSCRYCAHYHARLGLLAGLSEEETEALLGGAVEGCPREEVPALLYARHWAQTGADPDPKARRELAEVYGPDAAEQIETVLRLIRAGNLTGNTLDRLLHRLKPGRQTRDA